MEPIFSVIQSMRTNPDKYSSLVYSDNPSSTRDSNYKYMSRRLQQHHLQYYNYSVEDCKTEILDQAREFLHLPS
jgi:hypothetical protein